MTGRWSGMAPAVDAHLARWAKSDRGKALAAAVADAEGTPHLHSAFERALTDDWVAGWVRFGASYGIPDENGVPTVAAVPHGQGIDTEGATITGREQFRADNVFIQQGVTLAMRESVMLHRAATHYVSAEVMEEVTMAADLLEPEPLHETDLICPSGVAFFETPLLVPDLDPDLGTTCDLHVHVRAIGWDTHGGIMSPQDEVIRNGVTLFVYTSASDSVHGYWREFRESGHNITDDDLLMYEELARRHPNEMIAVDVIPWSFGVEWTTRDVAAHAPGTVPTPVGYQRRWFVAMMRLCWQEVIMRRHEHPKRAEARRWERLAKRKPLEFTTLRLRRLVDPNYRPTLTGVPLEHRQLVRGHWRNVHVKSLGPARLPSGQQDPLTHRRVWVEPYWRGPEDGPIGPLHKATAVVR